MNQLRLTETNSGVLLAVKARPGGRRNAVEGVHDGALKVTVTAPPEKGKANKAIADLLADLLNQPKGAIRLHRGAASSSKSFVIVGLTVADLMNRLTKVIQQK